MNVFDNYTQKLLCELNKLKVEYIVVGGYAVNYYGYRRTTGDIDLWIKPDNGINKKNILKSFQNLGVTSTVLKQLDELDFTKPVIFIDGEEPFKIDFMTHLSGVKWAEAWNMRVQEVVDDISVSFIHISHLKQNKLMAGRAKDHEDIRQLSRIEELRQKNK